MIVKLRTDKQVVTSFAQYTNENDADNDGGDYLFDIDISVDNNFIATSLSDNSIMVYDSSTLSQSIKLAFHSDTINALEFSKSSPHLLYSAASDKKMCMWDIRSPSSPIFKLSLQEEVTGMSVSVNDSLVAVGVNTSVLFHDIRKNKRLGEYADAHSDVITQLKFNPTHPTLLTSAAEDGLLCVYDTSKADKDETVVSVLNTECPIRRFGYFGDNDEGIYALSTVETASMWHFPSAQRIAHFPNVMQSLDVNYLVDCLYDVASQSLSLVAGRNDGNAVIARLAPGAEITSSSSVVGELSRAQGHKAVMRCCKVLPRAGAAVVGGAAGGVIPGGGRLITGGEDSRLCCWSEGSAAAGNSEVSEVSVANKVVGSGAGSKNSLKAPSSKSSDRGGGGIRHTPYG